MINRKYSQLKFQKTYIGGSKKEQYRIYMECQGGIKNGNTYDKKGNIYDKDGNLLTDKSMDYNPDFVSKTDTDILEFRRLIIFEFEDCMHVYFSRKFV